MEFECRITGLLRLGDLDLLSALLLSVFLLDFINVAIATVAMVVVSLVVVTRGAITGCIVVISRALALALALEFGSRSSLLGLGGLVVGGGAFGTLNRRSSSVVGGSGVLGFEQAEFLDQH